jgi:hypothetical protein
MKSQNDQGYILAGALVVLVVLSLHAAGVLAAASQELTRVRQAERAAQEQTYLQGRLVEAAAAIAGARSIQDLAPLREPPPSWLEAALQVSAGLERSKLDVNDAAMEVLREAGRQAGLPEQDLREFLEVLDQSRRRGTHARLLDDLLPTASSHRECFHDLFTVFSGGREIDLEAGRALEDDQLLAVAPGARLWIRVLSETARGARGRAGVMIVTGDVERPVLWLDVRPADGGQDCEAR